MKKIAVLLTLLLIAVASLAQKPMVVMVIEDTTAYLNRQLASGQLIYTTQDKVMRVLSVNVGPPKKFSWIMYSTTRYTTPAVESLAP